MVSINNAPGFREHATTSPLPEQVIQDAFHSYLKSSLTQAKVERLLDSEILSSAEGDLMITGPALCLYFAALRCTTNPPSVPLPRSIQSSISSSGPVNLSCENCPPAFTSFLRVWTRLVPQIQSLPPEQQHNLARIICNLPPVGVLQNFDLGGIAAQMRAVALEISQRRSFQDRYANALQAALDFDSGAPGGESTGKGGGEWSKRFASFVPPPVYEPTSPSVSSTYGDHLSLSPSTSDAPHPVPFPLSPQSSHSTSSSLRAPSPSLRAPSPTILAPGVSPAIEFIRETLYAALGDTLEQFPSLRYLLHSDPPRAYFASVSLAILFVSTNAVDFERRAIIGVMGTPLTLAGCPQNLRPLMMELIAIGETANEVVVEDDKEAIQALSEGNDAPEETRMERVKRILLEGVEYEYNRVTVNGGRRSAEGRAISFANRIGELAVRMTSLSAFRERQVEVFKVLAGIGT